MLKIKYLEINHLSSIETPQLVRRRTFSEPGAAVIWTVQKLLMGSNSGTHGAVRGTERSVEHFGGGSTRYKRSVASGDYSSIGKADRLRLRVDTENKKYIVWVAFAPKTK